MVGELEPARKGKVRTFRSDNGGDYVSISFQIWLKMKGIQNEGSAAYSPESNDKAERLNRNLNEIAIRMLVGLRKTEVQQRLWVEAVNTAKYLRNRMFISAGRQSLKTPYEVIMNKKQDLRHMRQFGCEAYVRNPKTRKKSKFEERAHIGLLVGFVARKAYKIHLSDSGKFVM